MKNNRNFRNIFIIIIILTLILLGLLLMIDKIEYQKYNINFNSKINVLIERIKKDYPNIKEEEIIEILESRDTTNNYLSKYGYELTDSFINVNNQNHIFYNIIKIILVVIFTIILFIILWFINYRNNKKINRIIRTLENINHGNYEINLDDMSEDNLGILKQELYKTTIMLKSMADNSLNDKIKLKDSLEDISHQLKTPLTSIYIMLDNIIDDIDMDNKTKNKFIKQIRREVTNINFLVSSLLKLSKFDANTITFYRDNYLIKDIVKGAILNVNNLCDLKNIKIEVKNNSKRKIYCDNTWQIEAITNILKNAVEHSNNDDKVSILIEENNIYVEIKIVDYGIGMDSEDLKHIFERFYKGKNSSSDSIGIGLALSKTIIEKDNGKIFVESEIDKGTTFTIKYYLKKDI